MVFITATPPVRRETVAHNPDLYYSSRVQALMWTYTSELSAFAQETHARKRRSIRSKTVQAMCFSKIVLRFRAPLLDLSRKPTVSATLATMATLEIPVDLFALLVPNAMLPTLSVANVNIAFSSLPRATMRARRALISRRTFNNHANETRCFDCLSTDITQSVDNRADIHTS